MTMDGMNESLEGLRERVRLLTMERESAKRVLEAAVDSLSPSVIVDDSFSKRELLSQTAQRLRSFIRLDSLVFFLFSADGLDFYPAYCDPPEALPFFEEEMAPLIDDGTFAWAVDRNKPVVITAAGRAEDGTERRLLLHSIMTPSGAAGMFMALLGEDEAGILDVSYAFFTVLLSSAAAVLQNAEFNRTVRDLNRELQAKIESLEVSERNLAAAIKAKELFLANVSHEVRTPLNGVMGLVAILESTSLAPRQRELLHVLKDESKALLAMINDLLDFSKMDAGKLRYEEAPFDFHELWSSVRESFAPRAAAEGLSFSMNLDRSVPEFFAGDSLRIRQLLSNLIGNAVKFTSKGSVEVTAGGHPAEDGMFRLEVSVRDTGIGISQKDREKLFEPFVQGDVSLTRKFGGTGLGLAISKRITEDMGGKIAFESEEGRGTIFRFFLPLKPAARPEQREGVVSLQAEGVRRRLRGVLALVVEDNATNRMVAVSLLNLQGIEGVDTAVDGVEAIEKLSSKRYDIVFMDIQMPRMDGLEAVSIIRDPKSSVMDHDAVVVAMTANVLPGDKERFIEAGMSDYIAKPLQTVDLLRILARNISSFPEQPFEEAELPVEWDDSGDTPFRRESLMARMGGDTLLCVRVLDKFVEDFPLTLVKLKNTLESGDMEEARVIFHTLRGASVNVEALQMARLAEEGNSAAAAGDAPRVGEIAVELGAAFEGFAEAARLFQEEMSDGK